MSRHVFSAMLMLIVCVAFAHAQTADLTLIKTLDQSVVAIPESTPPATPMAVDTTIAADTAPPTDTMFGDCGCQNSAAMQAPCGTAYGPNCGCHQPTWKEKCAYYRSIRQGFDRGPCCGDFGPLWASYCYDKQHPCCEACASATRCQTCAPRPLPKLRLRPFLHRCSSCGTITDACDTCDACDCDRAAGNVSEQAPVDIGQPPVPPQEPTETNDPEQAKPNTTDVPPKPETSARRGWLNRTARWLPSR